MKNLWTGTLALGVLLAGCTAASQDGTQISLKPVTAAAATRAITLHIAGPADLASGGKILNDAGAAVISPGGGNVISAGGGNVISAGGANLAGREPAFRVAAATEQFVDVAKASVQLFSLSGKAEGNIGTAGEDGKVVLKAKDKVLRAVANFTVGGKTYRVATMLAAGKTDTAFEVDPINTMVEARVRQIVGDNEALATMTMPKLARVWTICNNANITVAKEDLEAQKTPEQIMDRLTAVWKEAIDSKVTSQAEKDEIKAFVTELQDAVK